MNNSIVARAAVVAGLAVSSAAMPGCLIAAAAAAGAGTVAYVNGEFNGGVDAPARATAKAAEEVCKEMGLTIKSATATDVDGQVKATTGQDKSVAIDVKRVTDTTSKVSIRVGTFGDEALSSSIYEKIKAKAK
jgi:hypothetical protein